MVTNSFLVVNKKLNIMYTLSGYQIVIKVIVALMIPMLKPKV